MAVETNLLKNVNKILIQHFQNNALSLDNEH